MRIGVMSDSHGDLKAIDRALDQLGPVDVFFHLGDHVDDGIFLQSICSPIPVYTLRGNCDFGTDAGIEMVNTVIGEKRIMACHGHTLGVKSGLNRLFYQAKSLEADIALFGHTHHAFLTTEEGILIMNPGALSRTWGEKRSCGIITITEGQVLGTLLEL